MIQSTLAGPFIRVIVREGIVREDIDSLLRHFKKAASAGRFVVLTDITNLEGAPKVELLRVFMDGLKSLPNLSGLWLGDAVVMGSAAGRFALSMLHLVAPLPTTLKTFDNVTVAEQWCANLLRLNKLALPPELMRSA